MRIKAANIIRICLLFVMMLSVTGCTEKEKNGDGASEPVAGEGMNTYTIYYMNNDWTDFATEQTNIDQLEATENTIDKLMNLIISSDDENTYQVPVPNGMAYQRYTYDGQGQVTIMFNLDYGTAESYRVILCKMAFTKTLCQVEGVSQVAFEVSDLIGEYETDTSVYNEDSFSMIDDSFLDATYSLMIYTPDNMGKRLDKREIEIDALSYKAPEEQVIEALRYSKDWKSPLGEDVDILDIYVINNVCYVNFGKAFLDDVEKYDNKVYLYSMVNSFVELADVDKVVFEVEGSRELIFGEYLNFSQEYTPDYSICN